MKPLSFIRFQFGFSFQLLFLMVSNIVCFRMESIYLREVLSSFFIMQELAAKSGSTYNYAARMMKNKHRKWIFMTLYSYGSEHQDSDVKTIVC